MQELMFDKFTDKNMESVDKNFSHTIIKRTAIIMKKFIFNEARRMEKTCK